MLKPVTTVLFCLVFLVTSGCKQSSVKPNVDGVVEQTQGSIEQPLELAPAPVKKATGKAVMLAQLLEQAEAALQRGRLTQPAYDNAYDKFRAAMLLDPSNQEAKLGLDGVLLTLANNMRDDLSGGRLTNANKTLSAIEERFASTDIFKQLQGEYAAAKAERAKQLAQQAAEVELDPKQHLIPKEYLRDESDIAKAWFSNLGALIKAEDASIMIYARSDAEGRKIYRLIKESVTEYLVRGDIRISNTPKIQFLEPLP